MCCCLLVLLPKKVPSPSPPGSTARGVEIFCKCPRLIKFGVFDAGSAGSHFVNAKIMFLSTIWAPPKHPKCVKIIVRYYKIVISAKSICFFDLLLIQPGNAANLGSEIGPKTLIGTWEKHFLNFRLITFGVFDAGFAEDQFGAAKMMSLSAIWASPKHQNVSKPW